jgi:peptidoglycan/LPS O-acetylase OafA/YrhL
MNAAVAASGMVIFFILSGFLITSLLLRDSHIGHFLVRRVLRIVPLAWLVLTITLILTGDNLTVWLRNLSFTANWFSKDSLVPAGSHFWSLGLEMQFYAGVALLVFVLGKRGVWLLPVFALAVTLNRVHEGAWIDINTLLRADEILAGCILALIYHHHQIKGYALLKLFHIHPLLVAPIVVLSSHPAGGWLNYLRPYLACWMIGTTLFVSREDTFTRILQSQVLKYLATVSYALYVVHGGLRETWLASGEVWVKYAKRPLFFAVTFALAHWSTFYYESYFIKLGKRLTQRVDGSRMP